MKNFITNVKRINIYIVKKKYLLNIKFFNYKLINFTIIIIKLLYL